MSELHAKSKSSFAADGTSNDSDVSSDAGRQRPIKRRPATRFSREALLIFVLLGVVVSVGVFFWFFGMEIRSGELALVAPLSAIALFCVGQAIRYRFRMSLRTAALVIAVLAVFFAYVGRGISDARDESAALEEIALLGGDVQYKTPSRIFAAPAEGYFRTPDGTALPEWLRDVLGKSYFNPPVEVHFLGEYFQDEDLQLLASVREADLLSFMADNVTSKGIETLPVVPQVKTIVMTWNQVTPASVARLRQFKSLESVSVELSTWSAFGTPPPPRDAPIESHISYLAVLDRLNSLEVRVDNLSTEDVRTIANLPELEILWLSTPLRVKNGLLVLSREAARRLASWTETDLDDQLIAAMADFLDGKPVDISALPELTKSKSLRVITLIMPELTDEDLLLLVRMPSLEGISVSLSQVSADGVRAARRLRPDMIIEVKPLPFGLAK